MQPSVLTATLYNEEFRLHGLPVIASAIIVAAVRTSDGRNAALGALAFAMSRAFLFTN
jgi:hypothetical protein